MKLYQLTIETTTTANIYIYDDTTKETIESKAKKSMAQGSTIKWNNKSEQWIESVPQFDADFRNIFHADGNRIKTDRIEYTKMYGKITNRILKTVWMDYDKAWGN